MLVPALVLSSVLTAAGDTGRDGWPTLAGTGLLTLPSAETLRPGHVSVSFNVDNRDRDPLGLDLLDGSGTVAVGLRRNLEAYGHAVFSRVVSMPEVPALPPPPLDLVVPPGVAAPAPPYRALYAPTPYVDKRGSDRFDSYLPGDALLGVKARLGEQRGARPALAAAFDVKLPLSRAIADLRSGSGTGGVDLRLRAIAQWTSRGNDLLATAAYTRTGAGALGDRILQVDAGGAVRVDDRDLDLADRLLLGIGARHALGSGVALVLEGSADLEVGGHTPVLDAAAPVDALGGLQLRHGGARLVAALRYHGHALPSGERRPSPLGGYVDVTEVAPSDLAAYLARLGAGAALPQVREGTHRVVATTSGVALPPGARRLAADYLIRSEHQLGFIIALGWSF